MSHWEESLEFKERQAREIEKLRAQVESLQAPRKIDGKFEIRGGRIVKTSSGEAIPDDEPVHVFRGRDHLALIVLRYYAEISRADGCNDFHAEAVEKQIARFSAFATEHPERMKQPSVTLGAPFVVGTETPTQKVIELQKQVEALTKERDELEQRLIYRETETDQLIKAEEQKLAAFSKDVAEAFERIDEAMACDPVMSRSLIRSVVREERDKLREGRAVKVCRSCLVAMEDIPTCPKCSSVTWRERDA